MGGGGGSPTGERVEAPQALTCNTNTGVRIDPPGAQIDGDSGVKKSLGGLNPPRQIGPWIYVYNSTLRVAVLL